MNLRMEKFKEFVESEAKPRWENQDEEWPLRPGGGETYIQNDVLEKAAPYLTKENIRLDIRQNLISALNSHVNLLNRFEYSFARKFIEESDEVTLRDKLVFLLYGDQTPLKDRLSDILSWAKVKETEEKGKKSGINATVLSYILAMSDPKEFPYCKPIAYNAVVDTFLSKTDRRSNPIDRILHCREIYKELLHLLENEYGLQDGNLLDVHSLAYLLSHSQKKSPTGGIRYWTYSPGRDAKYWKSNFNDGIMTIGWDFLGDLSQINDKETISSKIQSAYNDNSSHMNSVLACYDFANTLKPNDIIFAKKGKSQLLGYGIVQSDYFFDENRHEHKHVRKVKWVKEGLWDTSGSQMALKTLTDITPYPDFVKHLRGLFDSTPSPTKSPHPYDKTKELKNLFIDDAKFEKILDILDSKHNVVLQGPPGVGKTFVARHIAYAMMGVVDKERVAMVQFHQSYSYEDFIQGFRPNSDGKFEIKNGVFYQFCQKAQQDPTNPHVFIIDEINRGNLSKIFGEIFMLVERDKRGQDFAIPLTYAQSLDDTFYIPENVYIIGTMNTADRSLAMVDYALRRRFAFITLSPGFENEKFEKYLNDHGVDKAVAEKLIDRMVQLNQKIAADHKNLGRGYCVGHSYFCPAVNNNNYDNNWYKNVIHTEIEPLLEEYWFDDPDKVQRRIDGLLL